MSKFGNLSEKKQQNIINGALKSFGANGYKKASVNDIAKSSGISKAMVFHYFGTKKDLYLYLVHLCVEEIIRDLKNNFDDNVTDFFDRILLSTKIEVELLKKYPDIFTFIMGAYHEEDDDVREELKEIFASEEGQDTRQMISLEGSDLSKFKEDVDTTLVMNMIEWMAEGYMNQLSGEERIDIDEVYEVFEESMLLLKNNLYK